MLKTGLATTVEILQHCLEWRDYFTCIAGYTFYRKNASFVCFYCCNMTLLTLIQLMILCCPWILFCRTTNELEEPHPVFAQFSMPSKSNASCLCLFNNILFFSDHSYSLSGSFWILILSFNVHTVAFSLVLFADLISTHCIPSSRSLMTLLCSIKPWSPLQKHTWRRFPCGQWAINTYSSL